MTPQIVKRCMVGAVLVIVGVLSLVQALHNSPQGLRLIDDFKEITYGKTITERITADNLITNVMDTESTLNRCLVVIPPPKVYDAIVSFALNVGVNKVCNSILVNPPTQWNSDTGGV